MSKTITYIANPVLDISMLIEGFPVEAEKHQNVSEQLTIPGGPANIVIAGARLGMKMCLLGTIGTDDAGQSWLSGIAPETLVDTSLLIQRASHPTPITTVVTAPGGAHVFLAFAGELNCGPRQFSPEWQAAIERADALLLDGWAQRHLGSEANLIALEIARRADVPVFFDPGPEIPHISPEWMAQMLGGATVVMLTEDEARLIVGTDLPPDALAEAIRGYGTTIVVLKRGGAGNIIQSATETVRHPGFKVEVVDTTGAGDTVSAAVMFAWLHGFTLEQMSILANAAGAAAVQKLGAGLNVPRRDEILAILDRAGLNVPL